MRNWLEYIPFIIIATTVRLLPRKAALKLGGWLGRFGQLLQPRRVRISTENLRKAFPDLSSAELQSTIDKMFISLGKGFIEMLRLDRYPHDEDLDHYFTVSGEENLREAMALDRGCIVISGHVGFWEAGTFLLPTAGYQTGMVAKPMRNPLVDAYFSRMRTASGSYLINSRKGARAILKSLQKKHCVGLLLDQHISGSGSIAAPFFGRPAHTTTIITQMATRYQIPIITAFAYRLQDDSYRCDLGRMVIFDGDLSEENIFKNTAQLNLLIEEGVRKEPSQWFWLHRRWRRCCEQ